MGLVLNSYKYNYSIIHLLPKTGLFEGNGHTVLNVLGDSSSFLVDPLSKKILIIEDKMLNKRLMNKEDLRNRSKLYGINSQKSIVEIEPQFWESYQTVVAYAEVGQSDMNDYFNLTRFLGSLIGSDDARWKRIVVNAVAAIGGRLPTLKVEHSDYSRLIRSYPEFVFLKYLAYFFIFNVYFSVIVVLFYLSMNLF
jgi:hypothetical protein